MSDTRMEWHALGALREEGMASSDDCRSAKRARGHVFYAKAYTTLPDVSTHEPGDTAHLRATHRVYVLRRTP